jgi:phosphatidate cytidylyltransferase
MSDLLAALILNPLDHPLFGSTVIRVAALLAVGLLVVLIVERKPWDELRKSPLFQKVLSWSIMAPTFLAAIFFSGIVGLLVIGYLVVQGLAEYVRLVGITRRYAWILVGSGVLTLVGSGLLPEYFLFAPLLFFLLVTLVPVVTGEVRGAHYQVTSTLFGYVYIVFSLSYLSFIRVAEASGVAILLLVGVSVALSDVLAFTIGSVVGGPKLAPSVSPNKTWAGVAGNVVGAFAGWALMSFVIPADWSVTTRVLVPVVTAAAAVYGDLVQSFVKRDFAVKDAGNLLPGFGGLLDRIDSLLIGLPVTYYAILVSQHFTVAPR